MRVLKPNPWLASLGALVAALGMSASVARADVTTDQSASIIIFPKVIADGTRDTLIHISNTGNSTVFAHCYYVNASPEDPTIPPGPLNPRRWQETDFIIRLTRQQPTIWRVSTGRAVNPGADAGSCAATPNVSEQTCPGFDPGLVPTVSLAGAPFEGELKCIQILNTGEPTAGNSLKGEAFIEGDNNNLSGYNAVGVVGIAGDENDDLTLALDNVEYNACPQRIVFNHLARDGEDPALVAAGAAPGTFLTEGELTLVPCTERFEQQAPTSLVVNIDVYDELEQVQSAQADVECWLNEPLNEVQPLGTNVFDAGQRNSTVLKTVIRPSNASGSGVLGVLETFRVDNITGTRTGSDIVNGYSQGARTLDEIVLSASGVCSTGSPNEGQTCLADADCGDGFECQ